MKTVKCLSPNYLIRKPSIPCKTLHNFTFFNYKSSLILSEIAAISAYIRESTNEIERFFSLFLESLRFTLDVGTASLEISPHTTVPSEHVFLLEHIFSRSQIHQPLFKGYFINSPLKQFVPWFFFTEWLLLLVSLRIYVSLKERRCFCLVLQPCGIVIQG